MGITWSFVNFTGHWTHVCTSRHSAATGWSRAVLWTLQGTGHTSARLGTHQRTAIELLHAFVRQNVHPLTAATFGDWLSPRAQAHYHKSQISTVKSNDHNFLIRLRWNLDYSTKGSSQSSKGKVPVFFHLRYIYVGLALRLELGLRA